MGRGSIQQKSYIGIYSEMMSTKHGNANRLRVVATKQYRKDYRRLRLSGYDLEKLDVIVDLLASGARLPPGYRNHKLEGSYAGCEECHVDFDWVLIYVRTEREVVLTLVRTGTHSHLKL